jgi:hypothetical protein
MVAKRWGYEKIMLRVSVCLNLRKEDYQQKVSEGVFAFEFQEHHPRRNVDTYGVRTVLSTRRSGGERKCELLVFLADTFLRPPSHLFIYF